MASVRSFLAARLRNVDPLILLLTLLFMSVGFLVIRSAGHGVEDWHLRQLRWYGIGLVATMVTMLVPYPKLLRWSPGFFLVGLALLVLVLQFGTLRNHARRWFVMGGVNLQPSEFMKVAFVLLIARMMRFPRVQEIASYWLMPLALAVVPTLLILKQPDLGTSLLFLPVAFAVVYVAGAPRRGVLGVIALGIIVAILAYSFVLKDYQKERIWSTYNYGSLTPAQRAGPAYQLTMALVCVANGGMFGTGYGEGAMTQSGALPEQHNDFVFGPIAEEWGFAGATVVLLLIAGMFLAILRVAFKTRELGGRLLCIGVAALFALQSLVEVGVTLGLAPTTGMPLPLISYGGSSFLVYMILLGLVQSVSIHRHRVLAR